MFDPRKELEKEVFDILATLKSDYIRHIDKNELYQLISDDGISPSQIINTFRYIKNTLYIGFCSCLSKPRFYKSIDNCIIHKYYVLYGTFYDNPQAFIYYDKKYLEDNMNKG